MVKVSKFQKQNTKFSHNPKNLRNFVHLFALASKKWLKQKNKIKVLDDWNYFTQLTAFIFLIQPLLEARAKNVQNFVGFLEYGRTWYFAFETFK